MNQNLLIVDHLHLQTVLAHIIFVSSLSRSAATASSIFNIIMVRAVFAAILFAFAWAPASVMGFAVRSYNLGHLLAIQSFALNA